MARADPALAMLLALDAEESPASEAQAAGLQSLPTLDERVDMFLRAAHGPERAVSEAERAQARRRILDAIGADLAGENSEEEFERGASGAAAAASAQMPTTATTATSGSRRGAVASFAGLLRGALLLPLAGGRLVTACLIILLVGGAAWSATWFYAARTAETAIAEWIDWEAKSGRAYGCGSRTVGGFPFRVEMSCTDPKATVVSEQATFTVNAKELRVVASILQPDVLVVELTGPVSGARSDQPTTLVGNWTLAQATIHGPRARPSHVSLVLEDAQFYQATQTSMEPLLTGDRLEIDLRRDAASSGKSVLNIAAHLAGGSIPMGGPIASQPFIAELTAAFHGVSGTTPKSLSASLREWQAEGGRLDVTTVRVQQGDDVATVSGNVGLSSRGRVDGDMRLTASGSYAQLAQSFIRDGQGGGGPDGGAAASLLGSRSRSIGNNPPTEREPRNEAARQRERQQTPPTPQSTSPRPQPAEVPIRFIDGAVYFGSVQLGVIPPLF